MSFSIYAPVSTTNPLPVDMTGGGPAVVTAVANASGNSTITPTVPNTIAVATITGAARTSKFILGTTGVAAGWWILLRFNQPATASIVEDIRNATATGTQLAVYTTDGSGVDHWAILAYFDGSAWQLFLNVGNIV
jgi:hypothetical protein